MSKIYKALMKAQEEKESTEDRRPSGVEPVYPGDRTGPENKVLPPAVEPLTAREGRETGSPIPLHPGTMGVGAINETLVTLKNPQSAATEQFKKIRSVVSQVRMAKGLTTLAVTSSLPGEGKTVMACNLAIAITQGLDDEAVLIDCDLRRPTVHRYFGFEGHPGLADFLSGRGELSRVIHEMPGLGLKIIPAGRSPESPAELLSSAKMAKCLEDLKTKFEDHYIILDTTPILLTAETSVLARMVDGILMVIMGGKTSSDFAKRAAKELPREKVIGIVFNNAQSKEEYSRYGYAYYNTPSKGSRVGRKRKRRLT
jgi:capsular exopolysaccharide synthesis family protein